MAIDTSIYGLVRPVEMPSALDSMSKAMTLKHLSLQSDAQERANRDADALRQAYAKNTNADGTLNQSGVLSELGKTNPAGMMSAQEHFAKMGKEGAESDKSKAEAANKVLSTAMPVLDGLAKLPVEQRAAEFPKAMAYLQGLGVHMPSVPMANGQPVYNDDWFSKTHTTGQQMKDHLDSLKTGADIANTVAQTNKTRVETAGLPDKMKSELNASQFGSRSPNAELSSQYAHDVSTVRGSQMAMNQMLDNYHNPSPQGDASLILNAFKIKFPTAPDVNSLEELTHAQAVPDAWKARAASALQGGLDQATRDNLLRDAASTFRANYDSYQGIKKRYDTRATFQNVNDPTLTNEPAIEKTFADAMDLQKKIGPYVPPTEREGTIAKVLGKAGKFLGIDEKTATASDEPKKDLRKVGSKVTGDELAQYATRHAMKLEDARKHLEGAGYVVDK